MKKQLLYILVISFVLLSARVIQSAEENSHKITLRSSYRNLSVSEVREEIDKRRQYGNRPYHGTDVAPVRF
jgi:hypothetical protein